MIVFVSRLHVEISIGWRIQFLFVWGALGSCAGLLSVTFECSAAVTDCS